MTKYEIYDVLKRSGMISLLWFCGMNVCRKEKYYQIVKYKKEHPEALWLDVCVEHNCDKSEYYRAINDMKEEKDLTETEKMIIRLLSELF